MEGLPFRLPPGSLSLTPNYVLWAAICFTLLLITAAMAWLAWPEPLRRVLRRLSLGDVVAVWLGYAALYHLSVLDALRVVGGEPWALWLLWGALGLYVLLRRLPLRRPELHFALAVLAWAGVIAAGQQYVQETAADAAALATQPQAVLQPAAPGAPALRPLQRVLLLTRVDAATRDATLAMLATLERGVQPDAAARATFRLERVPMLLDHYQRDLARLRTYEWLQMGLLAVVLLLRAFGHLPEWEAL